MTEVEFLGELVNLTGCALLCDVSNIYVSVHNMDYHGSAYIDSLPGRAIGEFHLGGFTPQDDESEPGCEVWIDTHAAPVADGAWDLYAYAIRRFGARPALIEWDNEIPPLRTLLQEAARADEIVEMIAPETPRARAG